MPRTRAILYAAAVLVLMAVPCLAASVPAQAAPVPTALAVPAPGCVASAADFLASIAAGRAQNLTPASAFGTVSSPAVVYHGYCHCACRFVKDCNTRADCFGNACLSGPSCC
ncbi:MAG TPA: hypothetical protein VIH93_03160 [Thermoanaerobaculia bacterium]|jgi:hypothetical protein